MKSKVTQLEFGVVLALAAIMTEDRSRKRVIGVSEDYLMVRVIRSTGQSTIRLLVPELVRRLKFAMHDHHYVLGSKTSIPTDRKSINETWKAQMDFNSNLFERVEDHYEYVLGPVIEQYVSEILAMEYVPDRYTPSKKKVVPEEREGGIRI